MTKEEIIKKVKEGSSTKQQICAWINLLPRTVPNPSTIQIGDVFYIPTIQHMAVIIRFNKAGHPVICTLTSKDYVKTVTKLIDNRFNSSAQYVSTMVSVVKKEYLLDDCNYRYTLEKEVCSDIVSWLNTIYL